MPTVESSHFSSKCSQDEEGNLLFEIPDEVLDAMGWKEGTVLDISANANGLLLREVVEQPSPPKKNTRTRTRKPATKGRKSATTGATEPGI